MVELLFAAMVGWDALGRSQFGGEGGVAGRGWV